MIRRTVDTYRRRILQGAGGIVLGLPALESFMTKEALAQASSKVYAVFMQQQNGCIQGTSGDPQLFWPTAMGPITAASLGAEPTQTMSVLKDYADKLIMVRGINFPFGDTVGCGHSAGCNQSLTAAKMKGSSNRSTPVDISADVRIANIVQPGKEPFTLYAGRKAGYLDDAFSYGPGGSVRAGENNPLNAYNRVFTNGIPPTMGGTPVDMTKQIARRKSINDLLRGQIQTLMNRPELSKADRDRLTTHFQSIRDIEVGMGGMMPPGGMAPNPDAMVAAMTAVNGMHTTDANMETVVKLQLELIAFTFASDMNRVATLQIGEGNDHTRYMVSGTLAPPYHYVSHRVMSDGGTGTAITNAVDLHHGIDIIHAGFFKHLLDKLSQFTLPDGRTLLDATAAVWLNSNANGPPHSLSNVPHIVGGSGGGFLKTGQHINAGTVTNNVFLNTIITAAAGGKSLPAPVTDFGDASLKKDIIAAMVA
jgi:uncharacterized protein DUF1552